MADKAFLVGINAYPGAGLNGCLNDINDMATLLETKCGFRADSVVLLADARATAQAVLDGLNWLVAVQPGDRVLFHYSGHGAQVPMVGGFLPNGLEDVICTVDFDWSPSHMITGKQFNAIFSRMPQGVKFNWISDSCHSGDLTKEMLKPNHKHRSYPIPVDIQHHIKACKQNNHVSRSITNGVLDVGYLSGCRSDQTSADAYFNGRYNGALTYFLLQVFNSGGLGKTLVQVDSDVCQRLASSGYDQRPQTDGTRQNLPFLS